MEKQLVVKKSTIPACGKGLFAKKVFKKGDIIGIFYGSFTNKNDIHTLWLNNNVGIKVLNILKYANHSKNGNSEVIGAIMYATKKINIGDEIFFDYNTNKKNLIF